MVRRPASHCKPPISNRGSGRHPAAEMFGAARAGARTNCCARQILTTLARRSYRVKRPRTTCRRSNALQVPKRLSSTRGSSWPAVILTSRSSCFAGERDPANVAQAAVRSASRLAARLRSLVEQHSDMSSDLASRGRLKPGGPGSQVRRCCPTRDRARSPSVAPRAGLRNVRTSAGSDVFHVSTRTLRAASLAKPTVCRESYREDRSLTEPERHYTS